jgi:hypothetical protein
MQCEMTYRVRPSLCDGGDRMGEKNMGPTAPPRRRRLHVLPAAHVVHKAALPSLRLFSSLPSISSYTPVLLC